MERAEGVFTRLDDARRCFAAAFGQQLNQFRAASVEPFVQFGGPRLQGVGKRLAAAVHDLVHAADAPVQFLEFPRPLRHELVRALDDGGVEFVRLGLQRAADLAAALAKHFGDVDRASGQGVVELARACVEAGFGLVDQAVHRRDDLLRAGRSRGVETIDLARQQVGGHFGALAEAGVEFDAMHVDGRLDRRELFANGDRERVRLRAHALGGAAADFGHDVLEGAQVLGQSLAQNLRLPPDVVARAFAAAAHEFFEGRELGDEIGVEAFAMLGEPLLRLGEVALQLLFEILKAGRDLLRHPFAVAADAVGRLVAAAQQRGLEGVEPLGQRLVDPIAMHADGGDRLGRHLGEALLRLGQARMNGFRGLAGDGGEIAVDGRRLRQKG